jgi:hypothetical protein
MFTNNKKFHRMKWWLEGKGLGLRGWEFKFHFKNVVIMALSSKFTIFFNELLALNHK